MGDSDEDERRVLPAFLMIGTCGRNLVRRKVSKSGDAASMARGRNRSVIVTKEDTGDQISAACFSPNGEYVASASIDGKVRLWSVASTSFELHSVASFAGHRPGWWRRYVGFTPDGKFLASAAGDGNVCIHPLHELLPDRIF